MANSHMRNWPTKLLPRVSDEEIDIFQSNLKELLKSHGITQSELARYLGMSREGVNSIVNLRNNMTKAQYWAIMAVLN